LHQRCLPHYGATGTGKQAFVILKQYQVKSADLAICPEGFSDIRFAFS
jgi:hypothetical protein